MVAGDGALAGHLDHIAVAPALPDERGLADAGAESLGMLGAAIAARGEIPAGNHADAGERPVAAKRQEVGHETVAQVGRHGLVVGDADVRPLRTASVALWIEQQEGGVARTMG